MRKDKIKLSDYVVKFLVENNVRHAFVITGGASIHLIDSISKNPDIEYICTQHEQASAMAADAYTRVTKNLGVAISTSGPGATNMITGICCSYYDSIPTLFITGQVSTFRLKNDLGVRQIGFQEADIIEICKPITKYAVRIVDPIRIKFELQKAVHIAKTGRTGPVLVDIPDDIQREMIDEDDLESFNYEVDDEAEPSLKTKIAQCLEFIRKSKRPVLILGWGIYLSNSEELAINLINLLKIPVILTWGMKFLLSSDNEYFSETCGTHGTRTGNFIVQNSDLIISIGARLDTHVTGSPMNTFARGAKKIIVEIDSAEIKKFKKYGLDIDIVFNLNAKTFIHSLVGEIVKRKLDLDINAWNRYIKTLKENYPVVKKEYFKEIEVNPYVFVYYLSKFSPGEEVFFIDTGCSIAWMMQSYDVKKDQKLFHAFNTTPMGYALPASIGGCFALNKKQVTCVSGDGGLQMNIQELATIIHHNLPIKIFLFNNHGYNMIQQTQDQWLSSRYEASSADSGLSFPDFIGLADVYGFKTFSINYNEEAQEIIKKVYNEKGPVFCNVEIRPSHRVIPQNKFGRPIEDSEPLLPRKEFLSRMIVNPMEVSLEE